MNFELEDFIDTTNQTAAATRPEQFDFDKQADHDAVLTSLTEALVEGWAARPTRRVLRGTTDIKYDHVELDKVGVAMSTSDFQYCQKEVEYKVLAYMPLQSHDHPVSHYLTEVNEAKVVERFGKSRFVDLFGNPKRQNRFGRNFVSYTTMESEKDVLRDFSDTPGNRQFLDVNDMIRRESGVKHFLMTHSAYYLNIDTMGQILHYPGPMRGKRRLYAIVHRHPHQAGFLNNGELQYEYVDGVTVRQWSVRTGEGYEHRSLEPMFHSKGTTTTYGNIVWTTNKLSGDTYLIEIAADTRVGKQLPVLPSLEDIFATAITVEGTDSYKVRSLWGRTWVEYHGPHGPETLHDVELFGILRRHIAGRARTQQTKMDLTLLCRRLCDKRDIFAKYQAQHDVPPEKLMWYVEAAFHADLEAEIDLMLSFRRQNHAKIDMHTKLMEDPGLYDNSWSNTAVGIAAGGIQVGSMAASYATNAATSVAMGMLDAGVSMAKTVKDSAQAREIKAPKIQKGIARAAVKEVIDVIGMHAEDIRSKYTGEEYYRSAATTVKLLDAMTTPRKFEVKYRDIPPPLPLYAPALPPRKPKA